MKIFVNLSKLFILIAIPLGIALFLENFHYGAYFEPGGLACRLYASYFTDLIQPFGLYFILCMFEGLIPSLKSWWGKALIVFLIPAGMEILQGFGLDILGRGFDGFDFLAYAAGGLLAALIERKALANMKIWEGNYPTIASNLPSK
ncbi:MAG: hypothetical protein HY867_17560 [Chloroflexi bacterium]|nr:hypothetical protein [Chloroflexota bacterium]